MKKIKHLLVNIIITSLLLYTISQYLPQLGFIVKASNYGAIITFTILGFIFRFLNTILKKIINIITIPLKVLTLGLSSIIVNIGIFYCFEILTNTLDTGITIQIGTNGINKLITIIILSLTITTTYYVLKKILNKN